MVVNISDSVAITQNFVSRAHLDKTVLFLRDQPQSVSGFCKNFTDPYALFEGHLRREYPELLDEILGSNCQPKVGAKGKHWESMVQEARGLGGFAFQFTEEDSEEESNTDEKS